MLVLSSRCCYCPSNIFSDWTFRNGHMTSINLIGMRITRLISSRVYRVNCGGGTRLLCFASSGNRIEPPNVPQLAQMAHLALSDEEVADWEPKLLEIVRWFDQLQAVQTDGVTPAGRVVQGPTDRSRADCPEAYADRADLLKAVPEMEGSFVKVPRIL
eukprot:jgi/Botrbrau1/20165/Bobra.0173s0063.1